MRASLRLTGSVVLVLGLLGCESRPLGIAPALTDAGPGADAGSLRCDGPEDCRVVQPFDCCNGCPRVMSRAELAAEPCYYDPALPPPSPVPLECQMDCFDCPPCFPQPLEATCEAGACVALHEGCPASGETPLGTLGARALVASLEAYLGQVYRMSGVILPGLPFCDDVCPAPSCCGAWAMLDGLVALTGRPCDLDLTLWSDAGCADTFHANIWGDATLEAGAVYELVGRVGTTGVPGQAALEVLSLTVLRPEVLDGGYAITIEQVEETTGNPDCGPGSTYPWLVTATAHLYLAEADDQVQVFAPYFICPLGSGFQGNLTGATAFEARVPIFCDDCCCDFELSGELRDGVLAGAYRHFDGTCDYTVRFTGLRE